MRALSVKIVVDGPVGSGKCVLLNEFASLLEKEGFTVLIGQRFHLKEHELYATKEVNGES
jgi:nucleoside-triphosphatase THEP1